MWFQHGKLRYNSKFDWSSGDIYLVDITTPDQLSVIHKMIVDTSLFNKLDCDVTEKDLPCVVKFEKSPYTEGKLLMHKSTHTHNTTRAILYNRPMYINSTFEEMFNIVDPTKDDDQCLLMRLLARVNTKRHLCRSLRVIMNNNYEFKKTSLFFKHFKCTQPCFASIDKTSFVMLDYHGRIFWVKDTPPAYTNSNAVTYEEFENLLKAINDDLIKEDGGTNLDRLCRSVISEWLTEIGQPMSKKQEYNYVARTKKGDLYLFKTLENPSNENWYACNTDVRLKIDNSRYQDIANNTCKKMLVKE